MQELEIEQHSGHHPEHHPAALWPTIVMVILGVALLASIFFFAIDLHGLFRNGAIAPAISRVSGSHRGVPIDTPNQIQGWMTFHYLEKVFHLPPGYLAATFGASNSNMTIDGYAGQHHLNPADFLQTVKNTVSAYKG